MAKLLFVVTEDWYFYTHRLSLAKAIHDAGYDVIVATRISHYHKAIEKLGIRIIPLKKIQRSSFNPIREWGAFWELLSIYRLERPDITHHVALKPVIYGSIAARLAGVPAIVNALGGLGFIFSSQKRLACILRPVLLFLFQLIFTRANSRLILQNSNDVELLVNKAWLCEKNLVLIPGMGYDPEKFYVSKITTETPIAMLVSRMIWDKGVGDFVQAAKSLKAEGLSARFVLVGMPDPENPSSITKKQLKKWDKEGDIEWWGHRSDMPNVLAQSWVVCLPTSYGEGVPKILIEAMASARPIITTDMPGCRELVRSNKNGLLISPRDSIALTLALKKLLLDLPLCEKMGIQGRKIAETDYTLARVVKDTLSIYQKLLRK